MEATQTDLVLFAVKVEGGGEGVPCASPPQPSHNAYRRVRDSVSGAAFFSPSLLHPQFQIYPISPELQEHRPLLGLSKDWRNQSKASRGWGVARGATGGGGQLERF